VAAIDYPAINTGMQVVEGGSVKLSGPSDGIITPQYRLISVTNRVAAVLSSCECKCLLIYYSLLACKATVIGYAAHIDIS